MSFTRKSIARIATAWRRSQTRGLVVNLGFFGHLRPIGAVVATITAVLLVGQAQPSSWETELWNGQQVVIDPATKRATIDTGVHGKRQLWDGVHRLSDGSTITIRSGVAIPNRAMVGSSPMTPAPVPTEETTTGTPSTTTVPFTPTDAHASSTEANATRHGHCNHLVLKTCGLRERCRDTEACRLAKQLRGMQNQAGGRRTGNIGWAETHCHEALEDEGTFAVCHNEAPLHLIACRALVEHNCANAARCQRSPLCRNARYLYRVERESIEQDADPTNTTLIRQRCIELLAEHAFFPPCR